MEEILNSAIFGIIVTYYPKPEVLLPLLNLLATQTCKIIIVDNTDASHNCVLDNILNSHTALPRDQLNVIKLGENRGIATALNIGIDSAIHFGCTHVILSDQDSLPAPNMVINLVRAFKDISNLGIQIGAVGPTYTDLHTKITYPFQVQVPRRFFYGHQAPTPNNPHIEALTLITSGTLIPIMVIQDVGLMREDFFIDHVDIEWCHRARSKGYRLFGTGYATMYQRMGESHLKVWYLRWRNESSYSPLRIYYRLRNFVVLCHLPYIDWRWKLRSGWYWTGITYSHVFFGTNKLETLKMGLKGIWHGLSNKMGRYQE